MLKNLIYKVLGGTKSEREIKRLMPIVAEINRHFEELQNAERADLVAKTEYWRKELRELQERVRREAEEDHKSTEEIEDLVFQAEQRYLDEILPEAFAVVKRASQLLLGTKIQVTGREIEWDMVPYDVQLIGAIVLHQGKIAEMKTGEGKTLVATMPIYLNALTGHGVHVVTVNDYLAERDSQWMGALLEYVGVRVGVILNHMTNDERREMYACDVTYGTNNEFGFDYLRDNMAISKEDLVQRGHFYAIVDEVDSVLIDEARTPLIISGMVESTRNQNFNELRPKVEQLVRKQTLLVNSFLAEAEEKLKNPETEYEAGILLLKAYRGAPKNRRLMKLFQQPGVKKLQQKVENDFLRDKRMPEIDEALYYVIDEKQNVVDLSDKGRKLLSPDNPEAFVIPDLGTELAKIDEDPYYTPEQKAKLKEELYALHGERSDTIHNISQLLRAYALFERDVDYVVQDNKVLIVDEFTGRILPGRRYSDGLHQALEAKERVKIEQESQTLATITLQNYFRMYKKLAGMTGTAATEAEEFYSIYKLDVVEIPTNKPVIRIDYDDLIFKTKREKYNAVIKDISRCYQKGQPVLVGTISVEVSETLSRMLKRAHIPHNVLNAKHHDREAEIVARAGQKHAVTIATNMAGRGTDIKLGEGVKELGGLRIIGTERHESRRIDLQLRGRSGRQGDPGESQFYLSLEDDLMRLFGSDRIARIMDRLGVEEGEVIKSPMVTKAVERAQKKVEARNFSIRKHLLEYDDVMNQQREVVYARRRQALLGENLEEEYQNIIQNYADALVEKYCADIGNPENWDWDSLNFELSQTALLPLEKPTDIEYDADALGRYIASHIQQVFASRKAMIPDQEQFQRLLQFVYLRVVDEKWREHLYDMDQLREGINLRAVGQKDPLIEYKREGYQLFVEMLDAIDREVLHLFFHLRIVDEPAESLRPVRMPRNVTSQHAAATGMGFLNALPTATPEGAARGGSAVAAPPKRQPIRVGQKVGRNDPCPCGSGLKYKKCHGRVT
jgi:preprotein translocase, SecA subunit